MYGWNSQPGAGNRVLAKTNLDQTNWVDVSGSITALGTNAAWTATNFNSLPQRFYRIVSP